MLVCCSDSTEVRYGVTVAKLVMPITYNLEVERHRTAQRILGTVGVWPGIWSPVVGGWSRVGSAGMGGEGLLWLWRSGSVRSAGTQWEA